MSKRMKGDKAEFINVFGNRKNNRSTIGGSADWSSIDCGLLAELINAVTSRGGAIRLGYTRDGGAYAVGLYYGDEKTTEYFRPGDDISVQIRELIELYLALPNSGGRAPGETE